MTILFDFPIFDLMNYMLICLILELEDLNWHQLSFVMNYLLKLLNFPIFEKLSYIEVFESLIED